MTRGRAPEGPRRRPAPGVALGDGQQNHRQSRREAQRRPASRSTPSTGALAGGNDQHHDRDDEDREGGGQPEHAVVSGVAAHQQAGHHQPHAAAEAQRSREHGQRAHLLVGAVPRAGSPRRSGRGRTTRPEAPGRRSAAAAMTSSRPATEPSSTMTSTASRTCFLLCRSASRPINGVAAAAASRFAVTAQLTATVETSSCVGDDRRARNHRGLQQRDGQHHEAQSGDQQPRRSGLRAPTEPSTIECVVSRQIPADAASNGHIRCSGVWIAPIASAVFEWCSCLTRRSPAR